jgi:hypothetical protein
VGIASNFVLSSLYLVRCLHLNDSKPQ